MCGTKGYSASSHAAGKALVHQAAGHFIERNLIVAPAAGSSWTLVWGREVRSVSRPWCRCPNYAPDIHVFFPRSGVQEVCPLDPLAVC
jgi:hypothetical protein